MVSYQVSSAKQSWFSLVMMTKEATDCRKCNNFGRTLILLKIHHPASDYVTVVSVTHYYCTSSKLPSHALLPCHFLVPTTLLYSPALELGTITLEKSIYYFIGVELCLSWPVYSTCNRPYPTSHCRCWFFSFSVSLFVPPLDLDFIASQSPPKWQRLLHRFSRGHDVPVTL